jgi:GNAT superfamily N-acetyltransferase
VSEDDSAIRAPEPLAAGHDLDSFESGTAALDEWMKRRARRNEAEGASRTFVACVGQRVIGYYSLAAGSVLRGVATGTVRRNMPDPVPIILLGRLAVDRRWQGKGLGADLLSDAVLRVVGAAATVGVRAILVHAISEEAKRFYEKHGFRASAVDPMTLMVTIEEAQKSLLHREARCASPTEPSIP